MAEIVPAALHRKLPEVTPQIGAEITATSHEKSARQRGLVLLVPEAQWKQKASANYAAEHVSQANSPVVVQRFRAMPAECTEGLRLGPEGCELRPDQGTHVMLPRVKPEG